MRDPADELQNISRSLFAIHITFISKDVLIDADPSPWHDCARVTGESPGFLSAVQADEEIDLESLGVEPTTCTLVRRPVANLLPPKVVGLFEW